MQFIRTDIPDLVIVEPKVHGDERGYFAKEIMSMAQLDCQVNPIETKDYLALNADTPPVPKVKVGCPTPAQRPHFSLLNKTKIKEEFGIIIPYWKDSLYECLKKMGERR